MTNPGYMWMPRDWLASTFVQSLKRHDRDIYRELLDRAWLDDGLPNDVAALARVLGESPRKFASLWEHLRTHFVLGDDGRWRNRKQESERTKQAELQARKSASAIKANEVRWSAQSDSDRTPTGFDSDSDRIPRARDARAHSAPAPAPAPPRPTVGESASRIVADSHEAEPGRKRRSAQFDYRAVLAEFPAFDVPPVRAALDAYCEARRPKHGTWTAAGMRIGMRKFAGKSIPDLVLGLESATEGPWQTIWPDKNAPKNGHAPKSAGPVGAGSTGYTSAEDRRKRAEWEAQEQQRLAVANQNRAAVHA